MSFVGLAEAVALVKDMKILFGKRFVEQWEGTSDRDLAYRFASLLSDVHIAQYQHGLKRMESIGYVPTMPRFKELCLELKIPGQDWLNVHEAWALCLAYENDHATRVTAQAMEAFKSVQHVMRVEGQKSAFEAFKGLYTRILENSKALGKIQTEYKPPLQLKAPESERLNKPATPEHKALRREHLDMLYHKLQVKPKKYRSSK